MHNSSAEIRVLTKKYLGTDFYIEIVKFKTKTTDPYEKKTKNRFELRNALYNFLKRQKKFIFEDALDLRTVPQKIGIRRKNYYSSLSHTEETGAFAFDSSPIGVDIEKREKIKKEIVARVSQKMEMALDSNFQLIWSIKEAAFKAIPFMVQPKTVSEIKIERIESITTKKNSPIQACLFSASTKKTPFIKLEGICVFNQDSQLALAKVLVGKNSKK